MFRLGYLVILTHLVHEVYVCSNCGVFFPPQGTALGIAGSFQMIGMGLTNIIVGNMLDHIT